MIDLADLADAARGEGRVVVCKSWLRQVHRELSDARAALAHHGETFGLPEGARL